jgi:hypothetical protein
MKMSISAEGFVASAHGEIDWIFKIGHETSKAMF